MELTIQKDTEGINWKDVKSLLQRTDMTIYDVDLHQKAFENSAKVIFIYHGDILIGCGRLISDFAYQSVIYDVAVDRTSQGKGIGKMIVRLLMEGEEDKNIILYATPGKEEFYHKFGFRRTKTGMGRFIDAESALEHGFID
ncbi:GNAT family N-acetyltransferase [Methanimicrococcus blatticola]|nr:GNAT family N-acetyltransferase [Methanimicrococcus blatticola]MBZ3935730.1 GNAT family N-acetyltransferase [Methanimicrococcus blatticola]MCC2508150.1 GNAT family N-acetyltransferase [Methanimicrococcus blatticola]